MKKQLFSKRLFAESFRQTCVLGILFSAGYIILSIIMPVISVISTISIRQLPDNAAYMAVMDTLMLQWPLIFLPCCIVPLLTLFTFRFLNKRNGSDFYHALPYTRAAIYFSHMATVLLWTVTMVVLSCGISLLCCVCAGKYLLFNPVNILHFGLKILASSFLVAASIGVAMSVTGNIFSNIVVSLLLIFLPRIFMFFIGSAPAAMLPIVFEKTSGFFSNDLNLTVSLVFALARGFFGGDSAVNNIASFTASAMIYTLSLFVLYLIIGCLLFYNRKSESAEKPAVSKRLQSFFRIVVTMVPCLFLCRAVTSWITQKSGMESLIYCLIGYLLTVLLYFVYEWITTKKWRGIFKTAPGLLVVAVLNIVLIFTMHSGYKTELAFTPDATEITSISPVCSRDLYNYDTLNLDGAVTLRAEQVQMKDDALIRLVSSSLKETADYIREHPDNSMFNRKYYGGMTDESFDFYTFKIESKKGTRYRTIPFTAQQVSELNKLLAKNEAYLKLWKELPEPMDGTLAVYAQDERFGSTVLPDNLKQQLFNTFKQELQTVDLQKYMESAKNAGGNNQFSIQYSATLNNQIISLSVPVFRELFPKSFKDFEQYNYEAGVKDRAAVKKLAAEGFNGKAGSVEITYYSPISATTAEEGPDVYQTHYFSVPLTSAENRKLATDTLYYCFDHSVDRYIRETDGFFAINVYLQPNDTEENARAEDYEAYSISLAAAELDPATLPAGFEE